MRSAQARRLRKYIRFTVAAGSLPPPAGVTEKQWRRAIAVVAKKDAIRGVQR